MKDIYLRQNDGSVAKMQRQDIAIDKSDPRSRGRRRTMDYKFWLHISSTDIQVTIETFHIRGRLPHKLLVDTKRISMINIGEFESAALPKEYNNLPANRAISGGPLEESTGSHYVGQPSQVPGPVGPPNHPHHEGQYSLNQENFEQYYGAQRQ